VADSPQLVEADGHFGRQPTQALVIQTADCIPLMGVSRERVFAIHAGWRSIALNIVGATAATLEDKRIPLQIFIGPHIRVASFEVGLDVRDQLNKSCPTPTSPQDFTVAHADKAKCYYNLSMLVRRQVGHYFPQASIAELEKNTFLDREYHSFRRDRTKADRQYSFVVLKNQKFASMGL
jgi:polyphenol oxidase